MFDTSVRIGAIRVRLYRAKVELPMVTSFGSLLDRPALIVEVEDSDGARGWGEVWCNFPAFAAEYRARFLRDVVAPMFDGVILDEPATAGKLLDAKLGVQAIQAGEQGLVAGVSAGLDQALWDLLSRRQGLPLWKVFGGRALVRVYASGVAPDGAVATVAKEMAAGHRAFKVRVGFGDRVDLEAVASVRREIAGDSTLVVDANQAWSARQTLEIAERLEQFDIAWIEEPIRADEPIRVWRELAARSPLPLSAGENARSDAQFADLIDRRLVNQLQPDVGKWGGVSGCLEVGRRAVASGIGYSPHWLGGSIGLAISLNLLGAVGGDGLAEIDVNANPLRDAFPLPAVGEGVVELASEPGFGFEPDFSVIEQYAVSF
jgi:L-alanine-DL-glutamate epimerase-like enolase superfamily enzyme